MGQTIVSILGSIGLRPTEGRGRSNRRHPALFVTSVIALITASLGLLPAVVFAAMGEVVPLIVALWLIVSSAMALRFYFTARYQWAVSMKITGMVVAGTLLAVSNPVLADFGLATVLLAPIYAALNQGLAQKRFTWSIAAFAVVVIFSQHTALLPQFATMDPMISAAVSSFVFSVAAAIVAITTRTIADSTQVDRWLMGTSYHHLIENVQDAVIRYSGDGEMNFLSESIEKLFGCKRFLLTGPAFVERIHVLDRPIYLSAIDAARTKAVKRQIEVRIRKNARDASRFLWVEIAIAPVLDAQGARPDGTTGTELIAVLRDISRRREIEQGIRDARRQTEEDLASKSRFLATIGHELRTPLNAIVGFSDMMLNDIGGQMTPEHREYAQFIHQSSHHLLDTVTMLLDMSRLEAGKVELQTEPFDVASLVGPCVKIVEMSARDRKIAVRVEPAGRLPAVVGDERSVRQVIINLLSNAIKFSHPGSEVILRLFPRGNMICIAVSDRGIGISAEDIPRIGQPFFQANAGLSRQYEGTGLGLSIVRGLVDLHDGELRIESELGRGTTVTVLLPINGPAPRLAKSSETVTIVGQDRSLDVPDRVDEVLRKTARG
ncbi:MAG: PAS domain-containing sensor histidine kinase [Alphaproteobacteria bacterium]|nr:PAS domain-containing sensor histidine kinase [Alphaproteobacteria bacterium]